MMTVEIRETPRLLAGGFRFTECPRWHDGMLYFSDMHDNSVYRIDGAGAPELIVRLDTRTGGLGFLPGGDLLIAAMGEARIVRWNGKTLTEHASFAGMTRAGINDMVVDASGRCFVGRYFHFDPPHEEPLLLVDEYGTVRETADRLTVANGMVLPSDGRRLIVAESGACRLAVLDLESDGTPANRRTFAQLPQGVYPDGIAGDDAGGVWVACTDGPGVIRVEEGGTITHLVPISGGRHAYACALGGPDGNTLFICTAGAFDPDTHTANEEARIETVQVPFRFAISQDGEPK